VPGLEVVAACDPSWPAVVTQFLNVAQVVLLAVISRGVVANGRRIDEVTANGTSPR